MTTWDTYLEISGRQSGKTERLVAAAKQHADDGGVALVVVFDGLTDYIRNMLGQCHGVIVIPEELMHSELVTLSAPLLENVRWFFDEFDWLKDVPIIDDAYYCTTARYLRKRDANPEGDTLLTLVNKLGQPSVRMRSHISKEDAAEHYANETERALLFEAQYMEPSP